MLGFGILWWMYRATDWHEFMQCVTHDMNWGWMLLSLAFGILPQMARAWRWRMALAPLGEHARRTSCTDAIFMSYAASLVIPRVGEVTRCGTLKRVTAYRSPNRSARWLPKGLSTRCLCSSSRAWHSCRSCPSSWSSCAKRAPTSTTFCTALPAPATLSHSSASALQSLPPWWLCAALPCSKRARHAARGVGGRSVAAQGAQSAFIFVLQPADMGWLFSALLHRIFLFRLYLLIICWGGISHILCWHLCRACAHPQRSGSLAFCCKNHAGALRGGRAASSHVCPGGTHHTNGPCRTARRIWLGKGQLS